eukprot:497218_1
MATKKIIAEAVKISRVECIIGDSNKLSKSVKGFFYQLKDNQLSDETNPSKFLPWAICSKNANHIFHLSYNITKKDKIGSFTTSQLTKHKCFKDSLKQSLDLLTMDEKRESNAILKEGATSAIIEDLKPFTLTHGSGIVKLIKSGIEVGVKLGRVPSDEIIKEIIPKRTAIKGGVVVKYKHYKEKKLAHFAKLDKQLLPPFHLSFDFVTTDYKKDHILGVLGHEACRKTKSIECYVVEIIDWEDLVAEQVEYSSDEYIDSDESVNSNEYMADDDCNSDDSDESCYETSESVDKNFVYDDWKDIDIDIGSDSDDEKDNNGNNIRRVDDGLIEIKLKTSVTGD